MQTRKLVSLVLPSIVGLALVACEKDKEPEKPKPTASIKAKGETPDAPKGKPGTPEKSPEEAPDKAPEAKDGGDAKPAADGDAKKDEPAADKDGAAKKDDAAKK